MYKVAQWANKQNICNPVVGRRCCNRDNKPSHWERYPADNQSRSLPSTEYRVASAEYLCALNIILQQYLLFSVDLNEVDIGVL